MPATGRTTSIARSPPRGDKQAARVAAWLDRQLPETARILCSPARRCEQTALALGRRYKVRPELGPDTTVQQLLDAVQWPVARQPVVVVGHQPVLGADHRPPVAHRRWILRRAQGIRVVAAYPRARRRQPDHRAGGALAGHRLRSCE